MNLWIFVFFPMVLAFGCYVLPKYRERMAIAATLLEFAFALWIVFSPDKTSTLPLVGNLALTVDGFRRVYIVVICLMWAQTMMLSPEYFRHHHNLGRYYFFNLMTLGATLGVFLAADLYTLRSCPSPPSPGSFRRRLPAPSGRQRPIWRWPSSAVWLL